MFTLLFPSSFIGSKQHETLPKPRFLISPIFRKPLDIVFKFLSKSFTLEEVRIVYELIKGKEVDKSNFRKKIVKYCQKIDEIEVTKSSGDYGADIIAYKDDVKYAIQCKKYASRTTIIMLPLNGRKINVNALQYCPFKIKILLKFNIAGSSYSYSHTVNFSFGIPAIKHLI